MRNTALPLMLAAALGGALAAVAAEKPNRAGTLSVERANGVLKIAARGGVLGRIDAGSIQFIDLTPNDRWFPVVNGIGRGIAVTHRGENITFRLLGGQYRLCVRGRGISISARGHGSALLDGDPDQTGDTGIWAVGGDADCRRAAELCARLPEVARRVVLRLGRAAAHPEPLAASRER